MSGLPPNTSDYRRIFLKDIPLLDVRAPTEFEKGSVPSSTNAPILYDVERAQVGTCYKESGQDAAVALGHRLVHGEIRRERTQHWIDFARANPNGYLYCFRGGQRSHIAQAWLREAGIDYPLVTGGYKAMRAWLLDYLEQSIAACSFVILGGRTGTGKTRLLQQLPGHLDLEALANHRGSSFGRRVGGQPSQIDFENRLAVALLKLREQGFKTLVVEDESKLIGRCCLPLTLKDNMEQAPILVLEQALETRVQIIYEEYIEQNQRDHIAQLGSKQGFEAFAEQLLSSLERISKRLGGLRYRELRTTMETALISQRRSGDGNGHRTWIQALLQDYYDPMYDYQLKGKSSRIIANGNQRQLADAYARTGTLAAWPTVGAQTEG